MTAATAMSHEDIRIAVDDSKDTDLDVPGVSAQQDVKEMNGRLYSAGGSTRVRSFACRDISFWYPPKSSAPWKKKTPNPAAINDVSCRFETGSLVAVIGASGAGKSTLLDILARRFNKGRLQGEMFVNGQVISNESFQEISGYVAQEDVFSVTSTPWEALMFIANLKLGPRVAHSTKKGLVESLAKDAGLTEQLHTRIGGVVQGGMRLKGISGGEKRRLALVACAITSPAIMFLDEPTSGLDSYAALRIMEHASDWATRGCIVLATIHQPRSQIWELFDEALILGRGGHQVFCGPVEQVPEWFASLNYPVPPHTSVPDFVIDLLNNAFATDRDSERLERTMMRAMSKGHVCVKHKGQELPVVTDLARLKSLATFSDSMREINARNTAAKCTTPPPLPSLPHPPLTRGTSLHIDAADSAAKFKASAHHAQLLRDIEDILEDARDDAPFVAPKSQIRWWQALPILLRRNGRNYLRNPGCIAARVIMVLTVAVLMGFSFYNVTNDLRYRDPALPFKTYVNLSVYMLRVLASLFNTCITLTLLPFVSISLFIYDRQFFNKESRGKLYPTSVYFIANTLLEVTINAFTGVLLGAVCYKLMGYGQEAHLPGSTVGWAHFFEYSALIVLLSNVGCLQAIFFSLISPNGDIAFVLNCGYTTISMLTAGFLIAPDTLASNSLLLASLQWVSVTRYGFRALVACETGGVYFPGTKNMELPGQPEVTAGFLLAQSTIQLADLNVMEDSLALLAAGGLFAAGSYIALKTMFRD